MSQIWDIPQTQKISLNKWFAVVPRHISGDPIVRFSWNFPDSKIGLWRIICKFGSILMSQIWVITLNRRKYCCRTRVAVGQESCYPTRLIGKLAEPLAVRYQNNVLQSFSSLLRKTQHSLCDLFVGNNGN